MKTIIIISMAVLGLGALAALAYLGAGGASQKPLYRSTYLVDLTDSFRVSEAVLIPEHAFSWNELNQGRIVRMRLISDVVGEQVSIMGLPAYRDLTRPETWRLESNGFKREKEVKAFDGSVNEALEELTDMPRGRDRTAVLEPLVQELIHLQEYPEDDRYVFVFSDLGENTWNRDNWVSSADTITMLTADERALWEHIQGTSELADLSGITVYIIHQSESSKRDAFFSLRAQYVKRRLVELGANVIIQGNIRHISLSGDGQGK